MKDKPFIIRGNQKDPNPCVVRVTYNKDKYIIVKCKTQSGTLKAIENALNAFARGGKNNPDGFYCHFYDHVKANPGGEMKVTYVSTEGDDAYKLLVLEQQELDAGRSNPAMLNNQTVAHIPPYDEITGLYGWIPPGAVLNFQNWLKRRKKTLK